MIPEMMLCVHIKSCYDARDESTCSPLPKSLVANSIAKGTSILAKIPSAKDSTTLFCRWFDN